MTLDDDARGAATEATQPAPEARQKVPRGERFCALPLDRVFKDNIALKGRSKNHKRSHTSDFLALYSISLNISDSRGSLRTFRAGRLNDLTRGCAQSRLPLATFCRASGAGGIVSVRRSSPTPVQYL
ncbi:MAG: hypothetical protein H0V18_11475 [Pyrinomonadaceae bacterium]|nr:hypothetical protein [Pyrinomonadaceae bacterium]